MIFKQRFELDSGGWCRLRAMFGLEKNAWIACSAVLFCTVVALGCDDESRAATFVGVPDVVVDTQFIGVADRVFGPTQRTHFALPLSLEEKIRSHTK